MKRIAIIGCGPRGLAALESLFLALENHSDQLPDVLVFEESGNPGSGWVYDRNQPDSNWLNIPERDLDIAGRTGFRLKNVQVPGFPSYRQWAKPHNFGFPDNYPPRSRAGTYLHQRFQTLVQGLEPLNTLTVMKDQILELAKNSGEWQLRTAGGGAYAADFVLLAIGHQATKPSRQNRLWSDFASTTPDIRFFSSPYPVEAISAAIEERTDKTIGLKGFGLSMIDLVRHMVLHCSGEFTYSDNTRATLRFRTPANAKGLRFIPFTLDGLCPVPKPANKQIDSLFDPVDPSLQLLEKTLNGFDSESELSSLTALIATLTAQVYGRLPASLRDHGRKYNAVVSESVNWLKGDVTSVSSTDAGGPGAALKQYTKMATGTAEISVEYCLGQVWRKCMRRMYEAFSHGKVSENFVTDFLTLDERIKRFSFGPPVDSVRQLSAMTDAGLLILDHLNDPSIACTEHGWRFDEGPTAGVMVNTVLDPPEIKQVTRPFIRSLIKTKVIHPFISAPGARTRPDGYLENTDGSIAMLGRLTEGSVVGSDSLRRCFSDESDAWAKATLNKLNG